MMRYIIVGNGIAAAACIEGIRSVDSDGSITVVSKENRPVYCRPLISYYLEGKASLEHMGYRDQGFYERMGAEVLYGAEAIRVDAEARAIELQDGTLLPYDRLCIATGSSPFVPSFEGIETVTQAFPFMTLDDALALDAAIDPTSRVLIVGAGLIGLKCAEGICGRVASITVCDLAGRVLSSILDDDCAALMQHHLEENGISFRLGRSVASFDGPTATMTDGETIPFDVLVLAVGVRANTALLRDADGEVGRGIVVDEHMRTSVPDIFAAGDCTEGDDISFNGRRVLAILPNAYLQGHAAGVNMAGGEEVHCKAIPMNSIGFFGLHAMTAGTYTGELFEERSENSIKRLYTEDGLLKGFMLVGCDERAGIYTSLIRERTQLDTVDFEVLKRAASSVAFAPEERRKRFGGAV